MSPSLLSLLPLIPLLPLAGFVLLTFFGRRLPGRTGAWLATGLVGVAFVLSVAVGFGLPRQGAARAHGRRGRRGVG